MTLIIFTRYPRVGRVKTRLIPHLGPEGAYDLHTELTEHTLKQLGTFPKLQIWFTGEAEAAMQDWLGRGYCYRRQAAGTLGEKMDQALQQVLAEGNDKAVLIGTDCPGITLSHIEMAFQKLESHDVVLGPAADGGYYLIGLRSAHPELFRNIPWGTDRVCALTAQQAAVAGLSVSYLETLADIDRPGDLAIWDEIKKASEQRS